MAIACLLSHFHRRRNRGSTGGKCPLPYNVFQYNKPGTIIQTTKLMPYKSITIHVVLHRKQNIFIGGGVVPQLPAYLLLLVHIHVYQLFSKFASYKSSIT